MIEMNIFGIVMIVASLIAAPIMLAASVNNIVNGEDEKWWKWSAFLSGCLLAFPVIVFFANQSY